VNKFNYQEDMNAAIEELQPARWKVFQVLEIKGENSGENAKRQVQPFLISDAEYNEFISRHSGQKCLVQENNDQMQNSYLLLDEYLRFLNCANGAKEPSQSILEVGVKKALTQSGFDEKMFKERGGIYEDWNSLASTSSCDTCTGGLPKDLQW